MNNVSSNYREVSEKLKYNPELPIGKGRYGIVFYGLFKALPVAVKRFQRAELEDKETVKREAQFLLKAKNHPNILRYFCTEIDEDFMFIATELCAGTLSDLKEGKYQGPSFENEKEILRQVTKGLAYLHSLGIVHRDLKPGNILIFVPESGNAAITYKPKMKLADFGLCKMLSQDEQIRDFSNTSTTNPNGTKGWMAPELYHLRRYGFKVDIFPLGCIFSYTLTREGKHPFGKDSDKRPSLIKEGKPMELVQGDLKEPHLNDGGIAITLIKQLLEFNPSDRPTAQEILDGKFFELPLASRPRMNIVDLIERLSILPADINIESPALNTDAHALNKFIAYCKQRKWEIGVIGIAMLALVKKHEEDQSIQVLLTKLASLIWSRIFGN